MYKKYWDGAFKKKIRAYQVCKYQKKLGITQKTAWFLLQRIREACNNGTRGGLLSSVVEMDGRERTNTAQNALKEL